ncbi:MAG: alkaline phosphatase [Bacteroidota bacterium]|nr:alkaline phosphatase [Bacteroidota bacterium]
MRSFLFSIYLLTSLDLSFSQTIKFEMSRKDKVPVNIILMIADGAGLSQITATMYKNGNNLNLESFKVVGLQKTHSFNSLITDSAASGTAMACGIKTLNGAIGVDIKNKPYESILKICEKKGYNSGMIVTSSIVHATPASFYANVISRSNYQEIANQLSKSDVDFFIGGGEKYFIKRNDKRNLINEMKDWEFVNGLDEFDSSTSKKVGYFIDYEEPLSLIEGRKPLLDIGLNSILKKLNSRNKPFFLLVEGSQVDWGGHDNDLEYLTSEYIEFDRAIGVALKFVNENPNTLLIVTADHETGGLGITSSKVENLNKKVRFSTKGHTASMVPVFSIGIGSKEFSGIYDNTEIFNKMILQVK